MRSFVGIARMLALAAVLVVGLGVSSPVAADSTTPLYPQRDYPEKAAFFDCDVYLKNTSTNLIGPVYSDSQRNTVLQHLQDAGVGKVRMGVAWVRIVDTPSYLSTVKKCADMIAAHGMSAILTLVDTPPSEQTDYYNPPSDLRSVHKPPDDCITINDPCDSIKGAAKNLALCLLGSTECNANNTPCSPPPSGWPSACALSSNDFSVEVWNEPNFKSRFLPVCYRDGRTLDDLGVSKCPSGSLFYNDDEEGIASLEYYHVLRAAWQGVNAASSGVTVVGGSAGQPATIGVNTPPIWITDLYNAGARDYMDVVSMHPYPSHSGCPDVGPTFQNVNTVVDVMQSNGDLNKPLWLTEFGWSKGNGRCDETPSDPQQSQRLSAALTYDYVPHNVTVEVWWLDDNDELKSPWANYICPSTDWECGEALLNDNLTIPTTSPNVYTTLKNAPQ